MNRAEQAILFRQITGHSRLNDHMYSKFKVGESGMCPFNADITTAEHLLQNCQLHNALRRDMWPGSIPMKDKLCDNLEELRRTAAFVRAIGVSVVCSIGVSVVFSIGVSVVCSIGVSVVCSIGVSVVCSIGVSVVCSTKKKNNWK